MQTRAKRKVLLLAGCISVCAAYFRCSPLAVKTVSTCEITGTCIVCNSNWCKWDVKVHLRLCRRTKGWSCAHQLFRWNHSLSPLWLRLKAIIHTEKLCFLLSWPEKCRPSGFDRKRWSKQWRLAMRSPKSLLRSSIMIGAHHCFAFLLRLIRDFAKLTQLNVSWRYPLGNNIRGWLDVRQILQPELLQRTIKPNKTARSAFSFSSCLSLVLHRNLEHLLLFSEKKLSHVDRLGCAKMCGCRANWYWSGERTHWSRSETECSNIVEWLSEAAKPCLQGITNTLLSRGSTTLLLGTKELRIPRSVSIERRNVFPRTKFFLKQHANRKRGTLLLKRNKATQKRFSWRACGKKYFEGQFACLFQRWVSYSHFSEEMCILTPQKRVSCFLSDEITAFTWTQPQDDCAPASETIWESDRDYYNSFSVSSGVVFVLKICFAFLLCLFALIIFGILKTATRRVSASLEGSLFPVDSRKKRWFLKWIYRLPALEAASTMSHHPIEFNTDFSTGETLINWLVVRTGKQRMRFCNSQKTSAPFKKLSSLIPSLLRILLRFRPCHPWCAKNYRHPKREARAMGPLLVSTSQCNVYFHSKKPPHWSSRWTRETPPNKSPSVKKFPSNFPLSSFDQLQHCLLEEAVEAISRSNFVVILLCTLGLLCASIQTRHLVQACVCWKTLVWPLRPTECELFSEVCAA